jgi:WD40 repeat protein
VRARVQYPNLDDEAEYVGHMAPCTCLAVSKSEELLATGGRDALVTVWDTSCMAAVQTFYGPDSPVASLSFSADSRWLAYNGNTPQGKTTIEVAALDRSQPVHRCVHSLKNSLHRPLDGSVYSLLLVWPISVLVSIWWFQTLPLISFTSIGGLARLCCPLAGRHSYFVPVVSERSCVVHAV